MTAEFFQHFKGGVYKKLAEGRDSETEEEVVVYQNCKSGEVWVRPKAMFEDLVLRPEDSVAIKGGNNMRITPYVPRFKPITLAEKQALVNWRQNPCPGTGTKPAEDKIIRKEASWPARYGGQIITKGRCWCPSCGKNISYTDKDGISAHKGKE